MRQRPHTATSAGTSIAQRSQRAIGRAKRARQASQTRWRPQSWHTAHWLAGRQRSKDDMPAGAKLDEALRKGMGCGSEGRCDDRLALGE